MSGKLYHMGFRSHVARSDLCLVGGVGDAGLGITMAKLFHLVRVKSGQSRSVVERGQLLDASSSEPAATL
jgi:hypothetical protein